MKTPVSVAERLAWAELIAPGVVLQTDGSFLAGWRYRGPDAGAASESQREHLERQVNDALLPFSSGWMFHVDRIRRVAQGYAPEGAFPDPATSRLDRIRREAYLSAGRYYETEHVLCATDLPPPESHSRWKSWFVSGGERPATQWVRVWEEFEARLRELGDRLAGTLHLERLDSESLLSHLYACLTGRVQWVHAPAPGTDIADLLAPELLSGFEPRVGSLGFEDRVVIAISVSGFPAETESVVLDALDRLPLAFRFSSRWIPMSNEAAARRIAMRRKLWMVKRRGLLGPDGFAVQMVEDAEAAAAEISSGEVRFGHYTPLILLMEPDAAPAKANAEEVLQVLRERGFVADVETVNAAEAFLGSIPGHGGYNLRRALISTRALTALLPLTSVWAGAATCPSPLFPAGSPALLWAKTEGSTPFRLNLHVGDVGHTLVLGPTGSGKSTLLAVLAAQWRRYPLARTALFDVDFSGLPLARASSARHYALAAGSPDAVRLQPLARIDDADERAWALEWLETLFALQDVRLTPAQRERVDRALRLVAQAPLRYRTLTELLTQLQDSALQTALRAYTVDGPFGHLLDASESDVGEADHEVFELRGLMSLGDRVLVPALLCLFRHVERRSDPRHPTLMQIDEAIIPLSHSLFGAKIRDWLVTRRKANTAVVLATQSLSHFDELPSRTVLLESCPTRLFLPNPEAITPDGLALYRRFGLSPEEAQIIATARPKRDYYYRSPAGARLFELGLSEPELEILTHLAPGGTDEEATPLALVG